MENIDKLKHLISSGNEILKTQETVYDTLLESYRTFVDNILFESWVGSIKRTIKALYGNNSEEYTFFTEDKYPIISSNYELTKTFLTYLNTLLLEYEEVIFKDSTNEFSQNPIATLKNIFEKFSSIAAQLLIRHDKRETIQIEDEYDVQDLLHAILKLFVEDIRPEERCPSYAGKKGRTDFNLKNEKIFIETKMTSPKLKDKEITEQLIDDRSIYSNHPDCQTLVCFVYDPKRYIRNKAGLINDIEKTNDLNVRVFIEH